MLKLKPSESQKSFVDRKGMAGFMLLEVLCCLLIFAMSAVMITASHSKAVQAAHDSLQRNQATWIARDLMERMRGNISSVDAYLITGSVASDPLAFCAIRKNCLNASCSTLDLVRYDIEQVICETTAISNPRLQMTCSASPCIENSIITVTVLWDAIRGLNGPFTETQLVQFQMMR